MGEMITKPDANPIVIALLNWFLLGAGGYFIAGQKKKAIISAVLTLVISTCTLGMGTVIWIAIAAYDGYLIGQKLQSGESIGVNENGLDFLNAIFKD